MPKPRKPVQIDLFIKTKKGEKPNPKLSIVKENKLRDKIAKQRLAHQRIVEKQREKIENINTKVRAYELAWQLINSDKVRSRSDLVEEAWWIVKKMSPAKGKNKVGRGAKFKRVFNPRFSDLKGLEVEKLKLRFAKRFIIDAEKILR